MSHHDEVKADKKAQESQTDAPEQEASDDDVEGHSLLTMSDAFVKTRMPSNRDLERDSRRQAELKEARANRKGG